jgi:hypothetical protein
MQSNTLLAPSESATQRNTLNMRDQMRPPPVDPSILRSLRQVESTPFEQAMIRFANITVFVFFAAVLFFTVLAKLPDRPPRKAAAPAKKAKSTGELRRDGKYTAAEVAKHDQPVRFPVNGRSSGAGYEQRAALQQQFACECSKTFGLTDCCPSPLPCPLCPACCRTTCG